MEHPTQVTRYGATEEEQKAYAAKHRYGATNEQIAEWQKNH